MAGTDRYYQLPAMGTGHEAGPNHHKETSPMPTTDRFYVQVIGPYDATFIGPFTSTATAELYADTIDDNVFDVFIMNEAAMRANVNEYGVAPLQRPEGSTLQ